MVPLLVILAISMFALQNICFKTFSDRFMKTGADYALFSTFYYALTVLLLLGLFGFGSAGPETLAIGVVFGGMFVTTILLYMKAMTCGPMSFTALLFCFALLVPILAGWLFWGERIGLLQAVALAILFVSFYLGSGPNAAGERRFSMKWLLLALGAFAGNGVLMSLLKWHQRILPGKEIGAFLVIAFATAVVCSLVLFGVRVRVFREQAAAPRSLPYWLALAGAGATTAFGNAATLSLAGRLPAVIQFPLVNGGVVVATTLLSVLLFREAMTKRSWTGFALGVAALVIISL